VTRTIASTTLPTVVTVGSLSRELTTAKATMQMMNPGVTRTSSNLRRLSAAAEACAFSSV
jgi:hypothetical protein